MWNHNVWTPPTACTHVPAPAPGSNPWSWNPDIVSIPPPAESTQSLRIEHCAVPKRLMMLVRAFCERQHIFKLFPETRSDSRFETGLTANPYGLWLIALRPLRCRGAAPARCCRRT